MNCEELAVLKRDYHYGQVSHRAMKMGGIVRHDVCRLITEVAKLERRLAMATEALRLGVKQFESAVDPDYAGDVATMRAMTEALAEAEKNA